MDTVLIDGVTYTKASVIAKKHKYTPDYIGQLARANKIDAQLVGRSWYVAEGSLLEHKSGRYKESSVAEKSLKTKSSRNKDIVKKSDKKLVEKSSATTNSGHTYEDARQILVYPNISKKSFRVREAGKNKTETPTTTWSAGSKYESDNSDLYPTPQNFNDSIKSTDTEDKAKVAAIAATWAMSEEKELLEVLHDKTSDNKIDSITAVEEDLKEVDEVAVVKIKDRTSPVKKEVAEKTVQTPQAIKETPAQKNESEDDKLIPLPRLSYGGRRDLTIKNLDNPLESLKDSNTSDTVLRPVIPKRPGVLKKISVTKVVNDIEPKVTGLARLAPDKKIKNNSQKVNHKSLPKSGNKPKVIKTSYVNNPFTPKSVSTQKKVKKSSTVLPWLLLIFGLITCFLLLTLDLQVIHDGETVRQTLVFNPGHLFDLILKNF